VTRCRTALHQHKQSWPVAFVLGHWRMDFSRPREPKKIRKLILANGSHEHLFLRRKDFLNTNLVNEVLTAQVDQMGSLLVVGQVCADAVDHHHDQRAIIHIQPIGATDKLICGVANEWIIKIDGEVRLIETCHCFSRFRSSSLVGSEMRGSLSGKQERSARRY
jgi:hypothetical protein